jgi:thymidylate synthase (FAD)
MTSIERKNINYETSLTKRPISVGAEKMLGEVIPVLDHGFVYLVDYLGNDAEIATMARTSYGRGTRKISDDRNLIRYLVRHEHTSPMERDEFVFHAKMPIFVARQWIRHRTASVNEMSGRYSILDKEFYIPEPEVIAAQSKTNKQGRGEVLDHEQAVKVREILVADAMTNYNHYEYLLNDDGQGKPIDSERGMVARELARIDLTLNSYTQWYWKMDLHNLFHFLALRMDAHAQYEIRQYAGAISNIVKESVPVAWEAFVDYQLEAVKFSRLEKCALTEIAILAGFKMNPEELDKILEKVGMDNNFEKKETEEKFRNLGII